MTQSGNSLMNVSRIEDYKVFLNPGLVVDKPAAIKKVVDAWSKQGWFKSDKFRKLVTDYSDKVNKTISDDIFTSNQTESFLRNNNNWFDDIFINNIKLE
jgi:hypothetical protein